MTGAGATDDLVETLRRVEERLRDLAYESLRAAAEDGQEDGDEDGQEDGQEDAVAHERRLQQARRAVERAIRALGGQEPEE